MSDLRRKIHNEVLNHARDSKGRCRCGEHQSREADSIASHIADKVYQVVLENDRKNHNCCILVAGLCQHRQSPGVEIYRGQVSVKEDFRVGAPPSVWGARLGPLSAGRSHYDGKPYVLMGGFQRLVEDPELLERDAADLLAAARWLREQREAEGA